MRGVGLLGGPALLVVSVLAFAGGDSCPSEGDERESSVNLTRRAPNYPTTPAGLNEDGLRRKHSPHRAKKRPSGQRWQDSDPERERQVGRRTFRELPLQEQPGEQASLVGALEDWLDRGPNDFDVRVVQLDCSDPPCILTLDSLVMSEAIVSEDGTLLRPIEPFETELHDFVGAGSEFESRDGGCWYRWALEAEHGSDPERQLLDVFGLPCDEGRKALLETLCQSLRRRTASRNTLRDDFCMPAAKRQ